mgnify:CR=1 FL=1
MLVLKRKVREKIIMTTRSGETIVITLLKLDGNGAKIGIDAPGTCEILREELLSRDTERGE